ncbi:MAG TPA: class I SAM-dependent methyltransferase [Gaiellales bacterium]|nr:class I SAM-dependent methyltransferase [Gaiellales bacterium]
MTGARIPVSPSWLALREPADARARSRELVDHLLAASPRTGRWVIHDLACGTGSMGRWLAPLLPGAQRWVLHDRDEDLLQRAAADRPPASRDAAAVTVQARRSDVTRLTSADLADASLITASALLDLMTQPELESLVAVCAAARCPVLFTISVTGRVTLDPLDQLDAAFGEAFNAHQRRGTQAGRLLGPDAVAAAVERFSRGAVDMLVRPSPWRLAAGQRELMGAWLEGWVSAACEQDAGLRERAPAYRSRRIAQAAAGELHATVDHADLLVMPR